MTALRTENDSSYDRPTLRLVKGTGTLVAAGQQQTGAVYRFVGKRLADICMAVAVLLLVSPILLVVWLVLRITLGPGVLLKQERVGKGGKPFTLLKFRTMDNCRRKGGWLPRGRADRRITHKSSEDPRHTKLGRVLRKFSFDELPQLFNILAGDMSLVGPRPELQSQASEDFLSHQRHEVRPGLTGPFQVSDLRGCGDLRAGMAMDEHYVQNLSFKNDLGYLTGTFGALRNGSGS